MREKWVAQWTHLNVWGAHNWVSRLIQLICCANIPFQRAIAPIISCSMILHHSSCESSIFSVTQIFAAAVCDCPNLTNTLIVMLIFLLCSCKAKQHQQQKCSERTKGHTWQILAVHIIRLPTVGRENKVDTTIPVSNIRRAYSFGVWGISTSCFIFSICCNGLAIAGLCLATVTSNKHSIDTLPYPTTG